MSLIEIKKEIKKNANPQKAELLQRFFKTGPGQYGEGDIFLGIMVPVQRSIAKKYKELSLKNIKELLNSDKHEERLIALLILVEQYKKGDEQKKEDIFITSTGKGLTIGTWLISQHILYQVHIL